MRRSTIEVRRGRSFGSGLVLLVLLPVSGCTGAPAPGPVSEAVEDYRAPEVLEMDQGRTVGNFGPAERLVVYDSLPRQDLHLLFLAGRAATLLDDGRSAWADLDGGRLVVFDDRGVVVGVLQGSPESGGRLERPAFVAVDEEGLWAVETDGAAVLFAGSEPLRWREPSDVGPARVGTTPGFGALSRTVFDIPLRPIPRDAPLLWIENDGDLEGLGKVEIPGEPLLAGLYNSGWVARRGEGPVYFGHALRPALTRYAPDGTREWTASWPTDIDVREPRFTLRGGGLSPDFDLVQHGVAVGPDGLAYVLAPDGGTGRDRILVFDERGGLLRSGLVPENGAIYVGRRGHLYAAPAARALARDDAEIRAGFPSFDLPRLEGEGRLSLDELRGRVVVVNFWASWCAPCRREMPLLDGLSRELQGTDAVVVGVDEDVNPAEGRSFLEEIGGVGYPVLEGRGEQRETYRYRGLPYTVVLDRSGKIVESFYGFGTSIAPIEEAVHRELSRGGGDGGGVPPAPPGDARTAPEDEAS